MTQTITLEINKVHKELRKEFGSCPECATALTPLHSFKHEGTTLCHGCYQHATKPKDLDQVLKIDLEVENAEAACEA